MDPQVISKDLEQIASSDDFLQKLSTIAARWGTNRSSEIVEPILQFMEKHPSLDFGMPGPLVHLVEQYYGRGYEQKLVESIQRKPTMHTAWMLNRVINGTKDPDTRARLIATLKESKTNPSIDEATRQRIDHFVVQLEG